VMVASSVAVFGELDTRGSISPIAIAARRVAL